VGADPGRLARRAPFPALVDERPDQFLLLGVHADYRVASLLMVFDLPADVTELRIAIRVLPALQRLGVGLQAEALFMQQVSDRIGADPVPLGG
jgi:hypothetical protein